MYKCFLCGKKFKSFEPIGMIDGNDGYGEIHVIILFHPPPDLRVVSVFLGFFTQGEKLIGENLVREDERIRAVDRFPGSGGSLFRGMVVRTAHGPKVKQIAENDAENTGDSDQKTGH